MALRLYNTLTNQLEEFKPLNPPRVTFYTCGPTVYDYAHIGNFRTFLGADVLRRTLEYLGYEVQQVMNLTDVGHMTDDEAADAGGPDKMAVAAERLRAAKKSGKLPAGVAVDPGDPFAIADFYAGAFLADAEKLGIKLAAEAMAAGAGRNQVMPRATQHIGEMIKFVERLIEKGHAYVVDGTVVYFDVGSFPQYGNLSGNTLAEIQSGAGGRVEAEHQAEKRHPADFMLWKIDPAHLMKWDSPWGAGYPGWHLECSVMAMEILGRETNGRIDLHSGGEDLIFPHHECEIAQSCCASGETAFANYWVHSRFLFVDGEKMSKSKGTFYTVKEVLARGVAAAALRLELIKTHYRINANFTFQGLKDSTRMVKRWQTFLAKAEARDAPTASTVELAAVEAGFREAIANDLNLAGALGVINKWLGGIGQPSAADAALLRRFDTVLGVLELEHEVETAQSGVGAGGGGAGAGGAGADAEVQRVEELIRARAAARSERDFARADALRGEIEALGFEIADGPAGTTYKRKLG